MGRLSAHSNNRRKALDDKPSSLRRGKHLHAPIYAISHAQDPVNWKPKTAENYHICDDFHGN